MNTLFNNTEVAFALKSDTELERAYFLFKLIDSQPLVKIGTAVTNFALKAHLPVEGLIRSTVFDHFCGGVNETDCLRVVDKMYTKGVSSVLDYSVEGKEEEAQFDAALNMTLKTIEFAREREAIPFAVFKPTGLNRTYPNVINYEGVNGLEQLKWSPESYDMVTYDVTIPFIRMIAGPMDYTQGAMRNAARGSYRPINSEPMSQGTRCRQLAQYVVFESPFNMLCDTPSNYMREPESTGFIADVPTVWDESIVLDGKMGEYIVTARRSGNVWYVGGITDWTARDIEVDCSFLGGKTYDATLFKDGANAHRIGRDYKCESIRIKNDSKLKIHLAPGGGFALKIK